MRYRLFKKKVKIGNDILGMDRVEAGTGVFTTLTGTTFGATTATITTMNATTASAAVHSGGIVRANTNLLIPASPWTGANMGQGSMYATGAYLYIGQGTTWKSASIG